MNKFLKKIIWISFICFYSLQIKTVQAIVPYYYFPTIKNLQKQSSYIGNNAYQLLYFGQYKDSLNLAKLAVKINPKDEKLMKDSIELVLTNKSIKSEMEERGYSYAHENFNGTKCAEKVLEVYSKLIF